MQNAMISRLTIGLALVVPLLAAAKKSSTPRFKWGQNKEQLFISVMVRDLDPNSVSVSATSEGELSFSARSQKSGEESALKLDLREDVKEESLKWEIAARPDKWGTATVITLSKEHLHRWDVLVADQKKYKGLMEKDWAREDQTLEPTEDMTYFDDAEHVLKLDEQNFNKTIAKHVPLIVSVRFPWCNQCKSNDEQFVKASLTAKARGKKKATAEWKKATFAYVDARSSKKLARRFDTRCTYTCEYFVFDGNPEEEPVKMKGQWEETRLLDDVAKFLGPAVQVLKSPEESEKLKAENTGTTALGFFASQESKEYLAFKGAANKMRGEMVFAASFGAQRDDIELWKFGGSEPLALKTSSFAADPSFLESWLRRRALPYLHEHDISMREKYEQVALPIARLWWDDQSNDTNFQAEVNSTVTAVAKKLVGKMVFVTQKRSMFSYELREYGLNHPEEFPAFGIAENASWAAKKYAFQITGGFNSGKEFWSDGGLAEKKVLEFCESVLAGTAEEAHASGPVHTNWTKGEVKKIAWKSFKEEIGHPKTNVLAEFFTPYRSEHESKLKKAKNLAKVLEPFAETVTVASYNTVENYVPPGAFETAKFPSDTAWYWIPANGESATQLGKPDKEPSMKKVVQLLASMAPELKIDVNETMDQWNTAMAENSVPEPKEELGMGGGMLPADSESEL